MQSNTEFEGVIRRIHKGLPYIASVTIHLHAHPDGPLIITACTGAGWGGSQGMIEEASAEGYDDWKAAAIAGVAYALQIAHQSQFTVTITCIRGRDGTDTNPTIVAVAAAQAVWKAIDFHPPDHVQQTLERILLTSWQAPEAIPTFHREEQQD